MAKLSQPYQCDVAPCRSVKGDLNHWFLLSIDDDGDFHLLKWDPRYADDDVLHICSEQCAQKALAKWMAAEDRVLAEQEITHR